MLRYNSKELNNYLSSKYLNLVKVYLITDNKDELRKDFIKRNQNTKEEVEKDLIHLMINIKHWSDYDYILVNRNLE